MPFSGHVRGFSGLESLNVEFGSARLIRHERQPPAVRRERRIGFVKWGADEMNYLLIPSQVDQPHVSRQFVVDRKWGIGVCDETAVVRPVACNLVVIPRHGLVYV